MLGSAKAFLTGQPLAFVASAYGVNSMLFTGSYLGEAPLLVRLAMGKLVGGERQLSPRILPHTARAGTRAVLLALLERSSPLEYAASTLIASAASGAAIGGAFTGVVCAYRRCLHRRRDPARPLATRCGSLLRLQRA